MKKKNLNKNHKLSVILLKFKMLSTGRCVQILSPAAEAGASYSSQAEWATWSTRMRGNLCISTQHSKRRTSMVCQCFFTARSVNHSWAKINPVKILTTLIFDRICRSPNSAPSCLTLLKLSLKTIYVCVYMYIYTNTHTYIYSQPPKAVRVI